MKLDRLFFELGYNISKHPFYTIIISLAVVGILLTGLLFLQFEVLYSLLIRIIHNNYGLIRIVKLIMNNYFSMLSLELFSESIKSL
jgi:hypothetical protein